jgi:hypothetical protein
MPMIALVLCAGISIVHAQPAKPDAARASARAPAPAELAPASAATAASAASDNDSSDKPDWDSHDEDHDGSDQRHRHGWHSRHGAAHRGNDMVSIGHDSHLPAGQKADSVVSIAGSSTSEGEADSVVSVLGNTRVTGPVSDSAVAVLGDTRVDSKIDGDVVAVLGDVELGPHAEIGGDVVAVGGQVLRDPAAIIHGDVRDIFAGNFGSLGWLSTWVQHCLLYGRPLALVSGLGWAWSLAFTCLAIYIILALLFRPGLSQCVRTFETQPGRTLLAALIAMLLIPVLVVLLCVTVIGIAAVPFVLFALLCAGMFGKAVMLAWIGKRVVGERSAGVSSHPAFAVLVGGLIVLLLYLVPVLGFLVYKVLGILGLGAVVASGGKTERPRSRCVTHPAHGWCIAHGECRAIDRRRVRVRRHVDERPIDSRRSSRHAELREQPDHWRFIATGALRASRQRRPAACRVLGAHGGVATRCTPGGLCDEPAAPVVSHAPAGAGHLWRGDVEIARIDHRRHRVRFAGGASGWTAHGLGNRHYPRPELLSVPGGGRSGILLDSLR